VPISLARHGCASDLHEESSATRRHVRQHVLGTSQVPQRALASCETWVTQKVGPFRSVSASMFENHITQRGFEQ